jgi:predicted naringenin-chalcone synthase
MELAKKILRRNSETAKKTLKVMGFSITDKGLEMTDEPDW